MLLHDWSDIPVEQMNPLLRRQVIHTPHSTLARLELLAGAKVPLHSHPNEQVSVVLSGKLRFFGERGDTQVSAGQSLELPPDVLHGVEALESSVVLDFFVPPREDWRRGEDAYLRI